MMITDYRIIRSRRKTISIEIDSNARLVVRAPMRVPLYEIRRFVNDKNSWIEKHIEKAKKRNEKRKDVRPLDLRELRIITEEALRVIPVEVERYAKIIGVTYGRVTIRNQKTLWGSCSSKGNLSFNCMLMKVPERVRDYVIVHELCHRREMNHSPHFWELVGSVIPDYKLCRKWLKEEGSLLLISSHDR
ncbi:MAG: M48 family metallopeptidase [Lachnospiraceae bacterium]|nr:M48 family metallopeptidase [Lachnospiraceae bacterium]